MPGLWSNLEWRRPAGRLTVAPAAPPADPRAGGAAELARELLHAVEQFVIDSPDLDSGRFLCRLRGTAASLSRDKRAGSLDLARGWVRDALGSFAAVQRRCVVEREDELWRLLDTYGRASMLRHTAGARQLEALRLGHDRMRAAAAVGDLEAVRAGLTEELARARGVIEAKARADRGQLAALAGQVARLEAELAAQRGRARLDALTGLPHRAAFLRAAEAVTREARPCTLALVNLDDFRTINHTLGHPVGDRLLVTVADQLGRVVRSVDLVGRFYGDEFAVLTPGVTPDQLCARLATVLGKRHMRLQLGERMVSVLLSASIGLTPSPGGEAPECLLQRASEALKQAKAAGKSCSRVVG